eukprot:1834787-Pyramimonas_sp.AAC.1
MRPRRRAPIAPRSRGRRCCSSFFSGPGVVAAARAGSRRSAGPRNMRARCVAVGPRGIRCKTARRGVVRDEQAL